MVEIILLRARDVIQVYVTISIYMFSNFCYLLGIAAEVLKL